MRKLTLAVIASAVLTACGGGSDSKSEPPPPPPPNQAPTVTIASETNYNEETTVSISANATDSDGSIASYQWTQTSGDELSLIDSDSATMSFTAPTITSSITLGFEVTVTDDDSATATASVTVTIDPVNSAPVVEIAAINSVNEQTEVTITGTVSDADGSISELAWVQTAGSEVTINDATSSEITFTAPTLIVEETLTFELSATDNEGAVSTEAISLQVLPVNLAPVAVAGDDVTVNPDVVATLSGLSSTDEDGTISEYEWKQTAGTDVTLTGDDSETLSFTPSTSIEGETLTFSLTVTDNEGANHTDSVDVYINEHPVAVANKYQIVENGYEVSIDANESTDDGTIVSYLWAQTAGTSAVITNADSAMPTFTTDFSDDEKVTFEVTVTDDMGLSSTDSVDIDVVKINRFINDTGVTVSATFNTIDSSCIATENKTHDCEQGRDADESLNKVGQGEAGFDFTKLDASGSELAADASSWSCVRDNHTGLIWEVKTTDGGLQHNLESYLWGGKGADGYSDPNREGEYDEGWNMLVDDVNDNSLCGLTNWALPTHEELTTILHRGKVNTLADLAYFPNMVDVRYWAANPYFEDSGEAWIVDFGSVLANDDGPMNRRSYNRVRLVSGGEASESTYLNALHTDERYIISADGTVTDLDTGLMWTRCVYGQTWDESEQTCSGDIQNLSWLNALEAGVDNNYADYNGWRLPNINELKTIFDITKVGPAMNTVAFPVLPTTNNYAFWSSTPDLARGVLYSLVIDGRVGDVRRKNRGSTSGHVFLVRNLHN
jgi:hypothetical protein